MSRARLMRDLRRLFAMAETCDRLGVDSREGVEMLRAASATGLRRRDVLGGLAAAGAATVVGRRAWAAPAHRSDLSVAIIGGGLAGLACADSLQSRGIVATIYEAGDYIGGRAYSLGGAFDGPVRFPGQVVERGGELIDTGHTTMRGYANELGLTLESFPTNSGASPSTVPNGEFRRLSASEYFEYSCGFVP